ncbi:hypothetical protein CKAH01_16178 [Colletotrichum kahawae]|uniref:ABM domain-containing protein n=1 Tax=Colletotrichum kahawae TaxID=34407 RepID=A0AAD9YGU0_COLKA|nr:hypothetical protein CKAH01_16178 [Colletotrichum kahawae]
MPYIVAVTPNIPPADKDDFLGHWPAIKADIAKQPGVLGVSGGEVIGENFGPVSEFKFFQTMAFASAEDEKAFADSAWAKEHFQKAAAKMGAPPLIRKFQTSEFPADKPKALTQFSFLELADGSQHEGAKQAWMDLVAAIGGNSKCGASADDGPSTGLGVLWWDSRDQAIETYKKPEVSAAWDKYKTFGKVVTILNLATPSTPIYFVNMSYSGGSSGGSGSNNGSNQYGSGGYSKNDSFAWGSKGHSSSGTYIDAKGYKRNTRDDSYTYEHPPRLYNPDGSVKRS